MIGVWVARVEGAPWVEVSALSAADAAREVAAGVDAPSAVVEVAGDGVLRAFLFEIARQYPAAATGGRDWTCWVDGWGRESADRICAPTTRAAAALLAARLDLGRTVRIWVASDKVLARWVVHCARRAVEVRRWAVVAAEEHGLCE
jgi:hypothetical protein